LRSNGNPPPHTGGFRSAPTAVSWLDAGATSVVLGTAAVPEVLRKLPRERVVAALDAVEGEVVVEGWKRRTGVDVATRMRALHGHVSGFLVTFVEREGRQAGVDLEEVERLADIAGEAELTVAGGIASPAEVAALDRMGVHAQVGMALYTGTMSLADAMAAPLVSDRPDGLWPTVVTDSRGRCLGLAWSSAASLRAAIEEQAGIYHSRRRGLWRKGETSGNCQELLRVAADCDRDALRFTVRQQGGFCHTGDRSCFGPDGGLGALEHRIGERSRTRPEGSYTCRLFDDPELLTAKLLEEAAELAEAADRSAVIHEAADVFYFAMVKLADAGVQLADVERELDMRSRRITRAGGSGR
ncbi:MAG: phosphoribosyl-ATP diphosphatase, partial [Acidimicrobiia bacterium]